MTTVTGLQDHVRQAKQLMARAVEAVKREFATVRSGKATTSLLELVKVVHKFAEEGRVAIRHARAEAISRIKKTEHVSEDEKKHAEKDVQKLHDDHLKQVDAAVKAKEAEIMEV